MVGHDQELRKFDAGEGHFEEQHIWYNFMFFMWVSFRDQKKWMIQENDKHEMDSGFTTFISSSIP